jgi:hypothetical protein
VPTRLAIGVPVALAVSRFRFARLRRAGPVVTGLDPAERLTPMMLSADGWQGARLTDVTLSYGRVLDVGAPLVELSTYLDGADGLVSLGAEIAGIRRRDQAIRDRDWERVADADRVGDEDAAGLEIISSERAIVVNGEPGTAPAASHHHYEALEFTAGSTAVRAVSRFPRPGPPRFEELNDLEPYFLGFTQFMLGLLTWRPDA